MHHMLCFSRNRNTRVQRMDDTTLRASCRLQDTVSEAHVEIKVTLPDLEISDVSATGSGSGFPTSTGDAKRLEKVVGVRIGPGVFKIIKGLIGDTTGLEQWVFMVEECCQAVILYFTKDDLGKAPRSDAEAQEYYADKVKANHHLMNRCAAFSPGSRFVEGIEKK